MGVPVGGVPVWRRALLGRSVKSDAGASNETTWMDGAPAYICALLKAYSRAFWNELPAG